MELRKVRAGPAPGTFDFDDIESTPAPQERLFEAGDSDVSAAAPATTALVTSLETALYTLEKALKMQTFYEGKGENYERVRGEAERHLMAVLDRFGEVTLAVTPFQLLVDDEPVYSTDEDKSGLSFPLFRDGLRRLSLQPGMESEEFEALMKVFAARSEGEAEYNAVTLLWELDLAHVKYRAVDMFMEGVMSAGVSMLSERDARTELEQLRINMDRPPFPDLAEGGDRGAIKRPNPDALAVANVQKERRLKDLRGLNTAEWRGNLDDELLQMRSDTWKRAMTLMARLGGGANDAQLADYAGQFARALEELLHGKNWDMLQAACRAMAPYLEIPGRKEKPTPELVKTGRIFAAALKGYAAGDKLYRLERDLQRCTTDVMEKVTIFFALLPAEADGKLVSLAASMSPGGARTRLIDLLERREADLSELHSISLTSGSQDEALEAIESLRPSRATSGARSALMEAARHKSTQVRLAAVKVLADQVDDAMVAVLSTNLGSGLKELQDLSLELLESLPRCREGATILRAMTTGGAKGWTPEVSDRVLFLLTRWGGAKVDQYLVEGLAAGNLFRRRGIEEHREKILDALKKVGGVRARLICRQTLDRSPPRATRASLESMLEALEKERLEAQQKKSKGGGDK